MIHNDIVSLQASIIAALLNTNLFLSRARFLSPSDIMFSLFIQRETNQRSKLISTAELKNNQIIKIQIKSIEMMHYPLIFNKSNVQTCKLWIFTTLYWVYQSVHFKDLTFQNCSNKKKGRGGQKSAEETERKVTIFTRIITIINTQKWGWNI